jgi:hypothetical protein
MRTPMAMRSRNGNAGATRHLNLGLRRFACRVPDDIGDTDMQTDDILEDFVPLPKAAEMPGMPSLRKLQQLAKDGRIPTAQIGKRRYLNIPAFRELLRATTIKVVTP